MGKRGRLPITVRTQSSLKFGGKTRRNNFPEGKPVHLCLPCRPSSFLQSWPEDQPMPWIASAAALHWGSVCVVKTLQILMAGGAGMKTKGAVVPLYVSSKGIRCSPADVLICC